MGVVMNYTTGPGETPQDKNAVDRRVSVFYRDAVKNYVEQAVRESRTLAEFIECLAFKRLTIDDLTDMERGVVICRYLATEAESDCGEIFHTMSASEVVEMFKHMGEGDTLSAGAVLLGSAGRSMFTTDTLNKYAKRYEERQQDTEDPRTDDRITEIRENRNE